MSVYTNQIAILEQSYNQAQFVKAKIDELTHRRDLLQNQYVVMLEAQQLLATVSDAGTNAVLDYITGIINKTLAELFPHDSRRIYLKRSLHNGQYAHINVILTGSGGKQRDLVLQSGTGLRQVISFLFVLSLIEIRKGRRILIVDEMLSGLHPKAKRVVADIIQIFAEEGFQFAMVEYGEDRLGKIYLVEKPGSVATITPLGSTYNNEVFVFNRPKEDVNLDIIVDESEED